MWDWQAEPYGDPSDVFSYRGNRLFFIIFSLNIIYFVDWIVRESFLFFIISNIANTNEIVFFVEFSVIKLKSSFYFIIYRRSHLWFLDLITL